MLRERLIASSLAISCCVAVVIFAAWTFPLIGARTLVQSGPQSSATEVVSGGPLLAVLVGSQLGSAPEPQVGSIMRLQVVSRPTNPT
jgi:hypothetical protein